MKIIPSDRRVLRACEITSHDFPYTLELQVRGIGKTIFGYGSGKVAVRDAKLFSNIRGVCNVVVKEVLYNITIWKSC